MSDIKARYVGPSEGVTLTVPVSTEGEPPRHVTIPHGGELPAEIDGHPVPASFRKSLLEQGDNWTEVRREQKKTTSTTTAAKADEKEA
jgi:hypothetical protein